MSPAHSLQNIRFRLISELPGYGYRLTLLLTPIFPSSRCPRSRSQVLALIAHGSLRQCRRPLLCEKRTFPHAKLRWAPVYLTRVRLEACPTQQRARACSCHVVKSPALVMRMNSLVEVVEVTKSSPVINFACRSCLRRAGPKVTVRPGFSLFLFDLFSMQTTFPHVDEVSSRDHLTKTMAVLPETALDTVLPLHSDHWATTEKRLDQVAREDCGACLVRADWCCCTWPSPTALRRRAQNA